MFKKLSSLIQKKPGQDALKKLSTISSHTTKELKEDLKEHSKSLNEQLNKIEQKVEEIHTGPEVYAAPTGGKYHKPDCLTLKKFALSALRTYPNIKDAKKQKLKACKVCNPRT